MLKFQLPEDVKFIINTLHENEHKAYIVGGCVRDHFLGREPHDYDICTSAKPNEIIKIFKDYHVIETGIKHGTVTIVINNSHYEITTFRIDGEYSDNRHPDQVTFTDDLIKDLSRRDFTMNAMAYNDQEGLIDPFNGQVDINWQFIYAVGNPYERIKEDPLRMLRALRFAVNNGFEIHHDLLKAIKQRIYMLDNIAKERIHDELCKMISHKTISITALRDYAFIMATIIPEFKDTFGFEQYNPYHDYDIYMHTVRAVYHCKSQDLITRLALLFHDIGKPHCFEDDEYNIRHFKGHGGVSAEIADNIMKRLKFSNEIREKTIELIRYHDATIEVGPKYCRRWLSKIGEEQFRRLLDVRRADIMAQKANTKPERIEKINQILENLELVLNNDDCFTLKKLAINGHHILAIGDGRTTGQLIGKILKTELQLVIDEKLENSYDALIKYAEQMIKDANNN